MHDYNTGGGLDGAELAAVKDIINILNEHSGMCFESFREKIFIRHLCRRAASLQYKSLCRYREYLTGALDKNDADELHALISSVTVNETAFFRDVRYFDYLSACVWSSFRNTNSVNILSAGCSTGEEPYSLTMSAHDYFGGDPGPNISVAACDIDREALAKCGGMEYPPESRKLKNIPKASLKKYFVKKSGRWAVGDYLKSRVRFFYLNIVKDELPGRYDIIFCKNVMIYFDRNARKELMDKLCKSLARGGFLFVGASEIVEPLPGYMKALRPDGIVAFKKDASASASAAARHHTPDCKSTVTGHAAKTVKENRPGGDIKKDTEAPAAGNAAVIAFEGIIDEDPGGGSYRQYISRLNEIIERDRGGRYIIDMRRLEFISHYAIEKLFLAAKYVRRGKGEVTILIKEGAVRRKLDRMGAEGVLSLMSPAEDGRELCRRDTAGENAGRRGGGIK